MSDKITRNGEWGKPYTNKVTVVLGAQWGDEGKGKVVDMLATHADLVCRCQVIIIIFNCLDPIINILLITYENLILN